MKLFRVLPFLVLPLACSEPSMVGPGSGPKTIRQSSPIQGGTTDTTSSNVVAILQLNSTSNFVSGICTGSLIAPNLVLTARHCVGDIGTLGDCSTQPFSSPYSASRFRITTSPTAAGTIFNGSGAAPPVDNSTWYGAAQIILDNDTSTSSTATNSICGGDMALIRLSNSITGVCPLVPRVDSVLALNETYTAKGFGITGPAYDSQGNPISTYQSTAGTRRTVSGMTVGCVNDPTNCGTSQRMSSSLEWFGYSSLAQGTCEGDSGGPSLDSLGRVTGAVSRGDGSSCNTTIYGSVYGHRAWIKAQAAAAATAGGYTAASWVTGGSTTVNNCGTTDGGSTGVSCPSGQVCESAGTVSICVTSSGGQPAGLDDCLSTGTCPTGYDCFYDDSSQATAHCYQECTTSGTGGGTGTTGGGTGTTGGGTGTSGGGTGTTGGGTGTTGGGTGTGGCQSGEFCPAGYGICLTNAGDLPADATVCSQSMTCTTAGASCYADSSGSSTGHCYRACTAPTYNCVGSGTTCFGVDSTTAFCLDSSTGGIPTSAGDCLSAPNSCPSSQTCVCTAGTTSCTAARCIEECGPGATGGGTGSTGGGTGTSGGGTGTSGGGTGTSGGGTGTTGGSGGTTGGGTGTTGGSGGTTGGGTATTGGSGGTTGGGTATTGGSGGTTGGGTATTGGSGGTTGGGTATTGGSGGFTGGGTGLIWPTGGGNGGGGGKSDSGCSCTEAPMGSLMWLALSGLGFLRRRRR